MAGLAAWREWLARNHARDEGAWLVLLKKASSGRGLRYADAVEEALCWGWIDSKPRALNERESLIWMAPRSPRSLWSRANRERVERLIAAGRMQPPGMAMVEAAKRNGTWSALEPVEQLHVPPDLAQALAASGGGANFAAFPPSARRGILEWILQAKRPQTRAQRIAETARLAARNERANQWKPKNKRPAD